MLVASGLTFFLAFILRDGLERRRLARWAYAAAAVGLAGMVVTGAAQSALTGGGLGSLARWSIDRQSFGGKFGEQCGAQLVGLAACLGSLHLRTTMGRQFAAFYGLLIAAGAFVLFGHAITSPERWLSIPADVVHVVFVAMWAGGLVGLVTVLRTRSGAARRAGQLGARRPGGAPAGPLEGPPGTGLSRPAGAGASTALLERPAARVGVAAGDLSPGSGGGALLGDTAAVVGRFSTMAGISFAGILVAGTLLAVAEVGSVANLFETGYGQLLLVKIALVGLLLFLAGYNRYLLLPAFSRRRRRPGRTSWPAVGSGWPPRCAWRRSAWWRSWV